MSREPQAASHLEREASSPRTARARADKSMIAGYFSRDLARAVKLLAVERGVTVQALVGEGLDHVLTKAGKAPSGER